MDTGETVDLLRSPLRGMSDTQLLPMLFGTGGKVYYMAVTTDSYINQVGIFASTTSRVSVVEVDVENYRERIIFERDASEKSMVLGLEIPTNNKWQFLTFCSGFGMDEDYLYFISGDIRKVNRTTGKVSTYEK